MILHVVMKLVSSGEYRSAGDGTNYFQVRTRQLGVIAAQLGMKIDQLG